MSNGRQSEFAVVASFASVRRRPWRVAVAAGLAVLALSGCTSAGYYWQAVNGHLRVLLAARPVDDWLVSPQTPEALRERLRQAQQMRVWGVAYLQLPDTASYTRYADVGRPYVVWNVVAAPPDSLTPKSWCFPVAGCVGYRGYYHEADARAEAAALEAEGLEVTVYGVPAYSTLNWLNWLGGDPLLNTFAAYPAGELARLMFHEMAHQVLYVEGDTAFNESFATAVERLGVQQWLAQHASPAMRADYQAGERRRREFRALTRDTRAALTAIYEQKSTQPSVERSFLAMKMKVMATFRGRYEGLKSGWQVDAARLRGYDAWVARANNASFSAQAAYDELVPGFEALYARQGPPSPQAWRGFYDAVKQLAQKPPEQRLRALKEPQLVSHSHPP